ncbi:MAG TPA: hypothetical protein VMP01_23790 [Pirellulaceae bacterium]|nr:hypothetical protein [Pirellulaceae bacterium]
MPAPSTTDRSTSKASPPRDTLVAAVQNLRGLAGDRLRSSELQRARQRLSGLMYRRLVEPLWRQVDAEPDLAKRMLRFLLASHTEDYVRLTVEPEPKPDPGTGTPWSDRLAQRLKLATH